MRFLISVAIAIVGVALIWVGCSDKSTDSGGRNPTTQKSIGPEGGTVEIAGQVSLSIPPGALADTVVFTITQNNAPMPPGGTDRLVSTCYSIEPSGTAFTPAAALTLKYNPSNLGNAGESEVLVYSHDSTGWQPLATVVDAPEDRAVAVVDHLCDFAAIVDTAVISQGLYAALVVGRTITVIEGEPFRMDVSVARFDSAYAPCNPVSPQRPDSVLCNQYVLNWQQDQQEFQYYDISNMAWIQLGGTYVFRVRGNDAVPNLTSSIDFPADEPYVTSPANLDTLSLSGFTVTWGDPGAGTVRFVLMRDTDSTGVNLETENDGSYSFTAGQLSGLQADDYGLIMIHQNSASINASGYDSRSFVWARVMNTTIIYLR